jgi:O-antigen/teichoic acid export membrane protein
VLTAPLAGVLILFSEDILTIWLGNPGAAAKVAPLARVLIVGTALNGLMNVPHALQLAYGWTRIGSYLSAGLVLFFIPALVALTSRFGALGAAAAWAAMNALYLLIALPLTHQRLLPKEARRWAFEDTAVPALAAITVALAGRALLRQPMPTAVTIGSIGALLTVALAAAALAAPAVRARLLGFGRARSAP